MNALTKAFVVVVTILSVVLVALVVPFAARVPDYAQQFEEMKQARDTQIANAAKIRTEILTTIAEDYEGADEAFASVSKLTTELGAANNEIKALQTQLDQARVTAARSAAGLEIAVRENENKSQNNTKQADLIQKQLGQIADLSSQNGDLSQTLIEARSNIRRLSDNYMRIQEQNKSLNQQLLESQAKLKTAIEELAGYRKDAEVFVTEAKEVKPPAGVTIRGSVTKIDQPIEGITLVQINVGKRDLVKPGMVFTVSRGDQYIAKVKIDSVDTAEAVGTLTLGGNIQEGDKAQAGGR